MLKNEIGTLRINNAGETIFLTDEQGGVVDEVTTGQASNGISKIPSNGSAEWIDSEQSTPEAKILEVRMTKIIQKQPTDLQPSEWNGKYDVKFTRLMPGEVPNR